MCSVMSSATSSRTGDPKRRRASSRSIACSRSSSRSSSTSKSALRVIRKAWCSTTSMPGNNTPRCAAMSSSIGRNARTIAVGTSARLHADEAVDVVGHLHAGEVLATGVGVLHGHREIQAQAADVGERVRGVDRQRGEHREDLLGEVDRQCPAFVGPRDPTSAMIAMSFAGKLRAAPNRGRRGRV